MSLIPGQLYPALYKGVRFLLQSHTLTAGRKTVTHEFPNADFRVVEDLGALPDTISITAITTGGNYRQERDNLIAALNSQGPGQLVHPFLGTLDVTATTYSLNESTSELNVAVFTMNFERSVANVTPEFSGQNISLINQLAITIADLLNSDVGEFIVSPGFVENFKDAIAVMQGMVSTWEAVNKPLDPVLNTVAAYDEAVQDFDENIPELVTQPDEMSNQVQNIFFLSDGMATDFNEKLRVSEQFFGTALGDPEIEPTTPEREERIENRKLLNLAMNLYSLLNGYNAFAKIEYTRFDLLESDFDLLEEQYQFIIENYSPSGQTLDLLKTLRVEIRKVFDNQRTNVRFLVPIVVNPQPLRVLTYSLYGNTDDVEDLVDINSITNPARVSGELLVFSE